MTTHGFDHKSFPIAGMRRRALLGMTLLGALPASHSMAAQGNYPSKPLRLIVPYTPGAATDNISRALAQELGTVLGQPVVVENRPGAGSSLGVLAVKSQPADGYTLLVYAEGFYSAKLAMPNLDYEFSDFEILASLGQSSYAFIVPADRGWNRLEDLKGLNRELDVGTLDLGVGAYTMLAAKIAAGLKIRCRTIPFKGGSEGLAAILSGQIDGFFTTIGTTQTVMDNPRVKALAYTGRPGSTSFLAGVKTFHELGIPNMVYYSSYNLAVRVGVPAPVREHLLNASRQAATSDAMNTARQRLYLETYTGTMDEYKRDLARLAQDFADAAPKAAK